MTQKFKFQFVNGVFRDTTRSRELDMQTSSPKKFMFVFEALGSLACGYYGNYIFFLLRDQYGFGNLGNLWVAALQGLVFAMAAWQGGRFAQRCGCFFVIRLGLIGMTGFLLLGSLTEVLTIQLIVLVGWTASMCLVWPALEASVSNGKSQLKLAQQLGIYNVIWAACSASSYFVGGAIFEHLGSQSIYFLPAGLYLLMLGILWRFTKGRGLLTSVLLDSTSPTLVKLTDREKRRAVHGRTFLYIAWLANPLACIAISTVLAMTPGLAKEFHLTTTFAGLFCSIWFFGRLASFILLWHWAAWHYRVQGLMAAFFGLIAGLLMLLTAHQLWILVLSQVIFGLSIGLIYYSSLFYSMDVGHTKASHGGVHEAAMGSGNCIGPATGAAGLLVAPNIENASAYAVGGLLVLGFAGLICLWFRGTRQRIPPVHSNQT